MRKVFFVLSFFLLSSALAMAQTRTVSGTVLSGEDGEPLVGASVSVKGKNLGTATNQDGKFVLANIPVTEKSLIVAYLGYETQEVAIANNLQIVLKPSQTTLDEVVVTAMGISRSEKTLGYSVTKIDGEEIAALRNTNVVNSLAGKVAGLTVQSTSGDPGMASAVIIRGFGSINGSNSPLYIVDGVPLQSSTLQASGHSISIAGMSSLAQDDIESVNVLKGAAATALYGSRASGGVIVVTTKHGQKGKGHNFTLEYNGGLQAREVSLLPTFQNDFGQGWNGTQTFIENGSWGPKFDGSLQVYGPIWNHQQLLHKYSAVKNNVLDFFDTGITSNHNISLSGVSADNSMDYYLSYSNSNDDGIMPTKADSYNRNTLAFRNGYQAAKWLKVSSSVNIANYKTDVAGSYQGPSIIDGLYEHARDVSLIDKKDLTSPFNTPEAYYTPYGITNPYWALANNYNHTEGKQLFGKLQADINPYKGLTFTYRYGFDYADYTMKMAEPLIALDDALIDEDYGYAPSQMNQDGYVYHRVNRNYETNHEFLVNYETNFDKLSVNAFAGSSINERFSTALIGQADGLAINGFWDLSNGSSWSTLSESQSKRRIVGLFGDVTFGYDDMVYLDVTARNDWSSTLPVGNNSYFYPGATLSWIFTRLLPTNDILSFGKARLAYGQTGRDASPYQTSTSFGSAYADGYYAGSIANFPMNGANAYISGLQLGSTKLQPEITTEFEAGLNLKFFNGRLEIDAAYYDRSTDKQIFAIPIDPSTGYTTWVTNFGEVNNKGVELMVNLTPLKTKNFRWDIGFNFAKNNNKVISLPEELEGGKINIYRFAAGNDAVYMYAEEGKPMGEFYTYLPLRVTDKSSPDYGKLIVDEYGQPVLSEDVQDTGRNMNHDWTGGLTSSFTAYGVTLSASLDIRKGGSMFSRTKNLMQFTGNGLVTTYNSRNPFVIPNSVVDNGDGTYSPNNQPIKLNDSSYQDYFDAYGWGNGGEAYLIDRSFTKLRNVSLSWAVPSKWVKPLAGVTITAFANNLFVWTAKDNLYIDPESSTVGSDLSGQFGELYVNPSCRIYGCNLSVKF
jgi:TonB-linked SusC/RagA family outer membrane protein